MRSIWKYVLAAVAEQEFSVAGAIPLSVGAQGDDIVMWCVVDDRLRSQTVRVIIRPTGGVSRADDGRFLGTVQLPASGLVFHIFTSVYG